MDPISAASTRMALVLFVSAALSGCAHTASVAEHAVVNPMPPLKPGVYDVKAVDVKPASSREVEPEYPPELRSLITGTAIVAFTVRADGKVSDPSIVRADDILFGEAAEAAILKWRFRPAKVNDTPVDCRMTMPFYFSILSGGVETDLEGAMPQRESPDEGSLAPGAGGGTDDSPRTSVEQR
jgi:protein TonB